MAGTARTSMPRTWRLALCAALGLVAAACGGGSGGGQTLAAGSSSTGSSTATATNVVSIVVDGGPSSASQDVNTLFTTVTLCAPGSTTNCQTIDHIQVDTASYGLRVIASALTVALQAEAAPNGGSLVECTEFVDGYSWGPVALADVQIGGETASSVPVQVIGDASFSTVPADCSSTGPAEDTVATFGANGILGVGPFAQDCGDGCVSTVDNGSYYACASSTQCQATTATLASQVPNPITLFATDNNGVIIQLPSVAAQGAVTGSMIFGVDTQTNNKSGTQTVVTLDPNLGTFTTVFNGTSLTQSFFDTGSNGLYFNDSSLAQCTTPAEFYCPASTQNLSAVLQGQDATSTTVHFSVDNAQTLESNEPSFTAFATLAGTYPTGGAFDWGLPFYFGNSVYTVIAGATTAVGTGPYVAF
jgi:hypothetical protein